METYANSIEDHLIDSLTFKLDPTANYVTNRQSVTYYTQGANIYQSGSGSRVIRFTLSGNGQYLDPSTVRMTFTLCNNGAANQTLFPVGLVQIRIHLRLRNLILQIILESNQL